LSSKKIPEKLLKDTMQHKKVKLYAIFLLSLGLTGLHAQETIPTSGGNALGSGGTVSYTVGQLVYTTNTGTTGSLAQGVQQPYEISVVNGIDEALGITLNYSAFPNPATDFLILKIDASTPFDNAQGKKLSIPAMEYRIYDTNGKLLEIKKIESNETSIDISNLLPSTYFLKIVVQTRHALSQKHALPPQEIKIFKIIKN
jgi:hypothetical protein